jgi:aminomethyltransferase
MALQGPRAEAILSQLLPAGETSPLRNTLIESKLLGIPATIARTGYTGEDGFEIFTSLEDGLRIWRALLEKGKPMGILPCGLGARDSLRLEAGLPLNGQDLSPEITPIEAGLGFFVDLSRPRPFPGRAQLEQAKKDGARRTTIGLVGQPKQAPPRHGYPVFLSGKQIGVSPAESPRPLSVTVSPWL